jgi:dnd system-associated protein 4
VNAPIADVRVRRPHEHERLMTELREDAAFPTFRDVLLFAAAVGVYQQRRFAFASAAGDPIRYETLTAPNFADALISMIATRETDDAEIMDNRRLEERVRIFEEYANGGLDYIQEQINVRHQPPEQVVVALVTEALSQRGAAEPASVEELLGGVTW